MSIPDLSRWLETPLGRYLMDWERAGLERMVADIFGYRAVQIGLPALDLLTANRMPFRFRCARVGSATSPLGNDSTRVKPSPGCSGAVSRQRAIPGSGCLSDQCCRSDRHCR